MKLQLPRYTRKDYVVLTFFLVPYTLLLNSLIFGARYYGNLQVFLFTSLVTAFSFSIFFVLCGFVAVALKKRFPEERTLGLRLSLLISTFLLMSGLFLFVLFNLFASITMFNYEVDHDSFVWAYFGMGIGNVFLTFLHEGIARYESWKLMQSETDELQLAHGNTRLQGLKSQVNPHFLFNSLNSLSSLINENESAAEVFLDEMSKVYRYMLRTDDDHLVTLDTELKFVHSYAYLLHTRYGDGLQIQIDVAEQSKLLYLPALTLQTIIEDIYTHNSISKSKPLLIKIHSTDDDVLVVNNNLQPKNLKIDLEMESGLDNLVNKYHLLGRGDAVIIETHIERHIKLPLLDHKKEVSA